MAICPKCGKEVLAEWNVCPNCGYPLSNSSVPPRYEPTTLRSTVAVSIDDKTAKNAATVLVLVLVLGGLFFLAPVVPDQQCSFIFCASATVSPSYYLFSCGMVLVNNVAGIQTSSGARWVC
jgi:hypothetical protein